MADVPSGSRSDEGLTLCWSCSGSYPIADEKCMHCGAFNANIDANRAYEEHLANQGRVGEPGKLDI